MAIKVDWGNDQQTVVYYDIKGKWTWLELEAGLQESIIKTLDVMQTVHEIYDLTYSQPFPENSLEFWRNALRVMPDNRGHMVFVGTDKEVARLLSVLSRMYPAFSDRLHTVDTLHQAHKLLQYLESKNGIA